MQIDYSARPAPYKAAPGASEVREILIARKAVAGRVSVIVPVYQGESFIRGAISSALRQTYSDFEVLVVNDGSTDETADRLREISDSRVTILQQTNQGLAAARNLGLASASGEYIAFLDADDRWFPNKLEIDIRTLEDCSDPVACVYGWYYAVDETGRLLHRSRTHRFSGHVFDTMLETDDFILPSASLFHRRIFEEVGGFDVGSFHEDRIFFLKVAKLFPIWPTQHYSVVYLQSIQGLGRRTLSDFARARHEHASIVDSLSPHITAAEASVLRAQQMRSLYIRFLMYGFNRSASRMLGDVDVTSLRRGAKGWLAWLFAKSRINLMYPLRLAIQKANVAFGQRAWRKVLVSAGLAPLLERA